MNSSLEQKKILEELKKYEWKFNSSDADEYKMFLKRQKDEEDFDSVSFKKLKLLYEKYCVKKDKSALENLFKK